MQSDIANDFIKFPATAIFALEVVSKSVILSRIRFITLAKIAETGAVRGKEIILNECISRFVVFIPG